jgi:RNA polymerase sigma-B factor
MGARIDREDTSAAPTAPIRSRRALGKLANERTDSNLLFSRWRQEGDASARESLFRRFTPMARSLARRYSNGAEPFDDLCQVAQLGLLRALSRYDPDRGVPFQAFAVPTILGELRRYFRDSGWAVHVPRSVQERALELREAERRLGEESGRAPTVTELAQFLELSTEDVVDGMRALRGYGSVSLDALRAGESDGEQSSYADSVGEEDSRYELVELGAGVAAALRRLAPRKREVLRMRFVEELTQAQIAERIGVSQMQVSRMLTSYLDELRGLAGAVPDATARRAV